MKREVSFKVPFAKPSTCIITVLSLGGLYCDHYHLAALGPYIRKVERGCYYHSQNSIPT